MQVKRLRKIVNNTEGASVVKAAEIISLSKVPNRAILCLFFQELALY
jgi:hypothetical protein